MAASRFAMVPLAVAGDQDLKEGDIRVLMVLIAHADKKGVCWPSRELISQLTGMRANKVSSATANLVRLGWISKSGSGGRGKASTYHVKPSPNRALNPPQIGTLSSLNPPQIGTLSSLNPPRIGTLSALNPPQIGTLSDPKPSPNRDLNPPQIGTLDTRHLLSELTIEQTKKKENTEKKTPLPPLPAKNPAAKDIPNEALFDQAWALAREVNRTTAGRCCRKTSVARWTAKCQDPDAAQACLECWELEVDSRRAGSGLAFQRGFQVFLNAEVWTEPHALEDLRAAYENTRNGNDNTNGNGNGTRSKTQAERYRESMEETRRRNGQRDPASYRIEGLDDDYDEFYGREEFKGRTYDA